MLRLRVCARPRPPCQNSKDYIHRVGRTARAGRSGRSVTLATQYDVELFQKIEHLTGGCC